MTIKLLGALADTRDDGTLRYKLLPYGEVGRTSAGKVTAARGRLTIPADVSAMFGNLEHAPYVNVSQPVEFTEEPDGLYASVRPLDDEIGQALAGEIAGGARTGISVEVDDPIVRGGELLGGTLSGYGHVSTPAFPSATLTASDVGDLPDEDEDQEDADEAPEDDTEDADEAPDDAQEGATMTASTKRPARKPGLPGKTSGTTTKPKLTASAAVQLLAEAGTGEKLTAALDQLTQAGIFDVSTQPEWLGELWDGVAYEPEYTPLINSAPLTSLTLQGWRFVNKPDVEDYAGDGAEVPTGPVSLEGYTVKASRMAAGWNVPRENIDFPNPEFWSSFLRLTNDSYAKKIDAKVRAYLLLAANASSLAIPAADIPATAPEALVKIVKGARYLRRTLGAGKATMALLGEDLFDAWLFLTSDEAPEYIQAMLGIYSSVLDGITIVGDAAIPDGTVKVGTRATATLHQLGGGTPLRVSTQDVAHGNMTEAVFGYHAIVRHAVTGLVTVTTAA